MYNLREGLKNILAENQPCTIRQLFYLAVSAGVIEKTEAAYYYCIRKLHQKTTAPGLRE
jgi:hypothetical protein